MEAKELVSKQFPDVYVCTSSEIWPQIREYERTLVSVVNCFVGRRMNDYFVSLQEEVRATGLGAGIRSTKSNGGIMSIESARKAPVETLGSGPASGVIGAHFVAQQAGVDKVIAMDMGGTSTEVAVIDGDIRFSVEAKIGDFEIAMPAVDVNSIGAGGGSVAWTDRSGVLKVGPRSAGAEPGPACYDRSGTEPTITDAYVVMGIIDPDEFLGGEMPLRADLATDAIDAVGSTLGLDRMATADAILHVATSNMYSALVPLMARKGVDLSEFGLLSYGGAGPTHGFLLAREVGIQKVLVPLSPGTLCALGALVADIKTDLVATLHKRIGGEDDADTLSSFRTIVDELTERANVWLGEEGIGESQRRVSIGADMRYLGQSFEVTTGLEGTDFDADDLDRRLRGSFAEAYAAIYGGDDSNAPIEIINVRATAIGITAKPKLAQIGDRALEGDAAQAKPDRQRAIFLDGQKTMADVFDRPKLRWGHKFSGPAIVEQYDTTTFIPGGFYCQVDRHGTIVAELK